MAGLQAVCSFRNYLAFVLFAFLLFPKLPLTAQIGILGGEVLLLISIGAYFIFLDRLKFGCLSFLFFQLFLFLVCYIGLSSTIGWLSTGQFPYKGYGQLLRVLLYFSIAIIISTKDLSSKNDYWFYALLRNSYFTTTTIALVYFIYARYATNPTENDVLWTVEAGARFTPLYGLTIIEKNGIPLNTVFGGSGNLYASQSLFTLIMASIFEKSTKIRFLISLLSIVCIFLAQSRGGILTLVLWFIYRIIIVLRSHGFLRFFDPKMMILLFGAVGAVCLLLSSDVPIFRRFSEMIITGQFDGSTMARFLNYYGILQVWTLNISSVVLGLGFDETLLFAKTGWTVVESFYLSVIFTSGLIGFVALGLFFFSIFRVRNQTQWARILFLFFVFNSLINWSITGGDFIGAPALFSIIICLALHQRSNSRLDLV